jgi:hypothetical protein
MCYIFFLLSLLVMNSQFISSLQFAGIPCKFAMKCTNPKCIFAHPSPVAPTTAFCGRLTKICRDGLDCTRPDCYFGHRSPALVASYFKERQLEWENNFTAFLTEEFPKSKHNAAFHEYLKAFCPEALTSNSLYCEIAKKLREEHQIQMEMDECFELIDNIEAEFDEAIEAEENQDCMDALED